MVRPGVAANCHTTITRTAKVGEMDHMLVTVPAKKNKQDGECWQFVQWMSTIGILQPSYATCKGLCLICHSQGRRSRVIAKFTEFGEPVFTSMDVLLYGLYSSFEAADFYEKKGARPLGQVGHTASWLISITI
jgi:hypothetical protein